MYVVYDTETQSMIGPFDSHEDAQSFIVKVEEMSNLKIDGLEVYGMTEPNEWVLDNMDNILMANF